MSGMVDYIEMSIPAKPEFVGVVRLTLSGVSSRMGFSYDQIEDMKIAASEACTNAVQHAYEGKRPDETGDILIGFAMYEDRLEVTVSDRGKSFDLEEIRKKSGRYQPSSPIEQLPEGGLGFYLIESLMDEVRVIMDPGVTVLMTKFLYGERAAYDATITNYEAN